MNRLKNSMFELRVLFVFGAILEFSLRGLCEIYPPIIWSPLNPIFGSRTSTNNDTFFTMNVLPMSKQNIICPNPVLNPDKMHVSIPKEMLHENLWIVDKNSFEACTVNRTIPSNRLLMKCRNPLDLKYYPLVFQSFSATTDVLEFERGKDYYFIATSNGRKNSLSSARDGHCRTHNMKIKIHVCHSATDPVCNPTPKPTTTTTTPTPPQTTTPTTVTTIRTTPKTTPPTPSTTTTTPIMAYNLPIETITPKEEAKTTPERREKQIVEPKPKPRASKGARCSRNPEDTTWLILVAIMGAIIAVSVSCNVYVICCKRNPSNHPHSTDDKRSSAAHALLRENSRVDKV